jgi:hypothetical protein
MSSTIPAPDGRTKYSESPVRQPPLRLLSPSPQVEGLGPIGDDHGSYPFAAIAFHEPDTMTLELWQALLVAWPHKRSGQRPNFYAESYAFEATRLGASVEDVASAYSIEPESARKKIAAGRRRTEHGFDWANVRQLAVVALGSDEAVAFYGLDDPRQIAGTPDHPKSVETQLRALLPPLDWNDREQERHEFDRANAAITRSRRVVNP